MKSRVCGLIFAVLILLLVSACSKGEDSASTGTAVQTIAWQTDANGFLQYSTNDTALYGTGNRHTNNTIQSTMTSVEAQVKRVSGSSGTGYGIVFCYQDSGDFYRIIITETGYYRIDKRVLGINYYYTGGIWSTTTPSSWPSSSHLITGYDNTNDIRVVSTGSGNFDVYFNGVYETSFNDATFTGGDSGYDASVSDSSREQFPSTPADMRFKQIYPDLSTAYTVERILWQNDGSGFMQFLTNDTNDCGTLKVQPANTAFNPMNSVEMQVKKISGYSHSAYGTVLCYQDNNNYYAVVLVVGGSYMITKKVSGVLNYWDSGSWSSSNPSPWPSSSHLITGYGNTNDIKVVSTGSGNFDVYFNGVYETSFVDTTFTGGYNGYIASVSSVSRENFPTDPVDVRVKLISAD
jgi:hypothetical protein